MGSIDRCVHSSSMSVVGARLCPALLGLGTLLLLLVSPRAALCESPTSLAEVCALLGERAGSIAAIDARSAGGPDLDELVACNHGVDVSMVIDALEIYALAPADAADPGIAGTLTEFLEVRAIVVLLDSDTSGQGRLFAFDGETGGHRFFDVQLPDLEAQSDDEELVSSRTFIPQPWLTAEPTPPAELQEAPFRTTRRPRSRKITYISGLKGLTNGIGLGLTSYTGGKATYTTTFAKDENGNPEDPAEEERAALYSDVRVRLDQLGLIQAPQITADLGFLAAPFFARVDLVFGPALGNDLQIEGENGVVRFDTGGGLFLFSAAGGVALPFEGSQSRTVVPHVGYQIGYLTILSASSTDDGELSFILGSDQHGPCAGISIMNPLNEDAFTFWSLEAYMMPGPSTLGGGLRAKYGWGYFN
jgi:hypothetical protein